MTIKNAYRKTRLNKEDYVNKSTGETFTSAHPNITSQNEVDPNYFIVSSTEYVIIDMEAFRIVETYLTNTEMNYVRQFCQMCKGEYNAMYDRHDNLHTRDTLMTELKVARTTFSKLMTQLHKKGIIAYHDVYLSRNRRVKYILLNPTLARRTKRITAECAKLFPDLTIPDNKRKD